MAWKPTTKMLWILGYLREHPGSTSSEVSAASPVDVEQSAYYNERWPDGIIGTGEPFAIPSIYPGLARASLTRLLLHGLIRFELSDNNHPHGYPRRWFIVEQDRTLGPNDPLEQAFVASSANREGG